MDVSKNCEREEMTSEFADRSGIPTSRGAFNKTSIVVGVMVLFYFGDIVNTILWNAKGSAPKFSIVFRALFEAIMLAALFLNGKIGKVNQKMAWLWGMGMGAAIFGEIVFQTRCPHANFVEAFLSINKYFFVFLLFSFFYSAFKVLDDDGKNLVYKIFDWIIYINAVSPVFGAAMGISLFDTYPNSERFGFKGFIPIANEASMFWLIALFYGMVVYVDERRLAPLFWSIVASVLLGTKALWLLMPLALLVFYWKFFPKYGRVVSLIVIIVTAGMIEVYLMDVLLFLEDKGGFLGVIEPVLAILQGQDVMPSLSSGRYALEGDSLRDRFDLNLQYWGLLNYLFGGMYAGTEMDGYDIFATFGIVGTGILMYGFYVIVFRVRSTFSWFFAGFFLLLALLGGHVFQNAMNMTYLCLFVLRAENGEKFAIEKNRLLVPG